MNIYFSGIGGVGIGPLAEIASDAGYSIQGSDMAESPLIEQLRQRGVAISTTQDGSFLRSSHELTPIDWFVHTAALPHNHPELTLAHELGIKTAKRDELLAQIIEEKNLKLIAVAGTHGKTTTTGMLVWTFQQLGIPASYSVGSTLSFGPSGKFDADSEYFIYECDEFDRNFLHFSPHLSLITSIGYDHSDTYKTKENYETAFRQFIHQSSSAILWQNDSDSIASRKADNWCLQPDEVLNLKLAGEHNRRNGTLVLKALEKLELGDNMNKVQALESFPGTSRRFEKLADNLYSDYGHHPVEIAATLQLAREVSDNVVLVYQPHQNSRQHEIKDEYESCFELAEQVYWLPTYLSREDPSLSIIPAKELIQATNDPDTIKVAELDDKLWSTIQGARDDSKLVLCMGAGSIDSWVRHQA